MIKVIKKIFDIILVLIIIIFCSFFVLRALNKAMIYSVKTGSMEDKIHIGDYILVVKNKKYEVGDIVTYKLNGNYITHRIINKKGNKITTKGDANNTEDESINESMIVGKVIISGGALNTIINYKYITAGILLSLYLFSCYFSKKEKTIIENK